MDASVEDAVALLKADAGARVPRVYALVNAYSSTLRRKNPAYARVLEAPDSYCLVDGASIQLGARVASGISLKRCPGPDLFGSFCATAAHDGTPIFLLGGGPGVVEALRDRLVALHPGLAVAGVATPPFGDWTAEQSQRLIDEVRSSGASVVWLGVSAPKQETWAADHLTELALPVVCVGAAFDFLAGRKPRAPEWVRRAGLEWLHRLSTEPARLWKRYLVGNLVFLWDLAKHRAHREG